MEVSGQLHAPAALPPEKESWYVLNWRLGRTQSRSGRCVEKKYHYPCQESKTVQSKSSPEYGGSMFFRNVGRGRATNLGRCDIFMKEVHPLRDKHDKLKIKERALFFTGELIIPAIGGAVGINSFVVLQNILLN
jgi:hypothetical protein